MKRAREINVSKFHISQLIRMYLICECTSVYVFIYSYVHEYAYFRKHLHPEAMGVNLINIRKKVLGT